MVSDIGAFGCLRSLRAHVALDGVSWVQSGSVEIAIGHSGRALRNRRRHRLPPSGIAPLGSSVRSPQASEILHGWVSSSNDGADPIRPPGKALDHYPMLKELSIARVRGALIHSRHGMGVKLQ